MAQIPDILDVLSLLASGVAGGFILSFLAEKSPWFQSLEAKAKSWFIFVISIGLPLLGQVLIQFVPVVFWDAVRPYWIALATGFVWWASSQHAYVREVRPATEERRWTAAEKISVLLGAQENSACVCGHEEAHCCANGQCDECLTK